MSYNSFSNKHNKNHKESPYTLVYNPYITGALIQRGEELLYTRPNLKEPNKQVFVFANSGTMAANLEKVIRNSNK